MYNIYKIIYCIICTVVIICSILYIGFIFKFDITMVLPTSSSWNPFKKLDIDFLLYSTSTRYNCIECPIY